MVRIILAIVLIGTLGGSQGASDSCGVPAITPVLSTARVRGGETAVKGSWPWQARVGMRNIFGQVQFFCGGTVLSKKYVLTAAHCFPQGSLTGYQFLVRLGDHSTQVAEVGQKDIFVKRVTRHSQFVMNDEVKHDIALLELSSSITYSNTISPACLPAANTKVLPGRTCVVTGWGSTVNQTTGFGRDFIWPFQPQAPAVPQQPILRPSTVLKQAAQPILEHSVCQEYWSLLMNLGNETICTYEDASEWVPSVHGEPCQGDSGGPLACLAEDSTDTWNVEGIVSFGSGCGQRGPAVFTRVASYIQWLNNNMK